MDGGKRYYFVESSYFGRRLDHFLARYLKEELSRSQLQKLIATGYVEVDGKVQKKSNYRLKGGQGVELTLPAPKRLEVAPEEIKLDILYEDRDIIVVNKPRGMVVHPAPGHEKETLVNALLFHCRDLSGIGGVRRPGIVHRLDKDTSGAIIVAKNDLAHLKLAEQLKARQVKRLYLTVVKGKMRNETGTITAPIGRHKKDRKRMAVRIDGREATTHYRVLAYLGDYTLLETKLDTGRTHQIRVHLAYLGHPVAGDPVYGRNRELPITGQALHARLIGFYHPRTGSYMEIKAPIPGDFRRLLKFLKVAK
ncbi:MAG: RluA family pseudouridine synthase [Dethiobacteria bacterium]|nr:RluA family pseudouridine synthase [Bacillota bacterium]